MYVYFCFLCFDAQFYIDLYSLAQIEFSVDGGSCKNYQLRKTYKSIIVVFVSIFGWNVRKNNK